MPNNVFSKLWDTVKGVAQDPAQHFLYAPIPKARTDSALPDDPLLPERSYFRLWLSQMFLSNRMAWFKTQLPAVHASVRLNFGGQAEVTFTRVAEPLKDADSVGVLRNYRLTELVPFNGGTVEIEAGLLALPGANYLNAGIKLLASFSSLVAAPLGQAVAIAEKVSNGVDDLMTSTQGKVHLPFHQTFISPDAPTAAGAQILRPCYIAVVLATTQHVNPSLLSVADDALLYTPAGAERAPLTGYDYMLFRIEGRAERDDFRLKDIQEPLLAARKALLQGKDDEAEAFKRVALMAVWQSPDLAEFDRRRVAEALKAELKALAEPGARAVPGPERDLGQIVAAHAMPLARSVNLGKLRFEQLWA